MSQEQFRDDLRPTVNLTNKIASKMQGQPPPYSTGHPPPMMQVYPHPQVVQSPGVTVVHTNMTPGVIPVVIGQHMGPKPSHTTCRSCNCQIVTRVEGKATTRTHLFAALLCLLGCWPCVWVPYCMDTCNNANHYCPNCNAYIGSYIS